MKANSWKKRLKPNDYICTATGEGRKRNDDRFERMMYRFKKTGFARLEDVMLSDAISVGDVFGW